MTPEAGEIARSHQAAQARAQVQAPTMARFEWELAEYEACREDPAYFIHNHCQILDKSGDGPGRWVKFELWPFQLQALDLFMEHNRVAVLKARQLGFSWVALGYALWLMIFCPIAEVLIFSKKEEEAIVMLDERLKGMYERLPGFLRCAEVKSNASKKWILSNGSSARAFSKSGGDSYNATLVILDEFDLLAERDQSRIMRAVTPTVGDGGQILMISRVDKDQPSTTFKTTCTSVMKAHETGGKASWALVFVPWYVRPDRVDDPGDAWVDVRQMQGRVDAPDRELPQSAWYEAKTQEILERTGSLDELHEQYPSTVEEALSPRTQNKRIPGIWLKQVYRKGEPIDLLHVPGAPPIPSTHLRVYKLPVAGRQYVAGADLADGLANGDESTCTVKDKITGESVAHLVGHFEPRKAFPARIALLLAWFNDAPVLPERNAHCGGAFITALENFGVRVLFGPDRAPGYNTTHNSKTQAYDGYVEFIKEAARIGQIVLHDRTCYLEIGNIDRGLLCAPEKKAGKKAVDDLATSEVLADVARGLDGFEYRVAFEDDEAREAEEEERKARNFEARALWDSLGRL